MLQIWYTRMPKLYGVSVDYPKGVVFWKVLVQKLKNFFRDAFKKVYFGTLSQSFLTPSLLRLFKRYEIEMRWFD